MLNILFTETANNLRSFLQNILPAIDDDWWKKHVVSALSFQQQRRVEENKTNNLSGLDLAALLRVLDKNWYEISEKAALQCSLFLMIYERPEIICTLAFPRKN